MKKRMILITGITTIAIASIGGMAFAQSNSEFRLNNNPMAMMRQSNTGETTGLRNNSSCHGNENMLEIMRENGFEDMAIYMEEGNFEAMNEWMNNLSEEDYEKMLAIMNENGYGNMARMMESIGMEGMMEMHESMGNRRRHHGRGMGSMMKNF